MLRGKKIQPDFPHNGFLQILFENGIIGLFVIFGGFVLLMFEFIKAYRSPTYEQTKFFLVTVFGVFWIDFFCIIVNESFYSKYTQYSFSVIIGIMMALISKSKMLETAGSSDESDLNK